MKASTYLRFCGILMVSIFLLPQILYSQNTQVIKGKVLDKNTFQPLIGANVYIIENGEVSNGVSVDLDGNFRMEGVSLGRRILQCTFTCFLGS